MSSLNLKRIALFTALTNLSPALADTLDWVNPSWLLTNQARTNPTMMAARKQIISNANTRGASPPWSVTNSTVLPLSGNPHDYLSWAPYHWPNCNWCSSNQKAFVHESPPTNREDDFYETFQDPDQSSPVLAMNLEYNATASSNSSSRPIPGAQSKLKTRASKAPTKTSSCTPSPTKSMPASATWTICPYISKDGERNPDVDDIQDATYLNSMPLAVFYNVLACSLTDDSGSSSTSPSANTPGDPNAANPPLVDPPSIPVANTSTDNGPAVSIPKAPSGRVPLFNMPKAPEAPNVSPVTDPDALNPDTGSNNSTDDDAAPSTDSNDPNNTNTSPQSNTMSSTNLYAHRAINYIDTFFLNPSTYMSPNLQYGQSIRGPGSENRQGQFMGVLDARGLVQVWNMVAVLRMMRASEWTGERDRALMSWAREYMNWLTTSILGQKAAMSANNHGTFWMVQVAALKYITGDYDGVRKTINYFVTHQFQDQIAASGEQPFEAVRSRPFHYRCFNLEALITLAKIGDQVGVNMWASQARMRAGPVLSRRLL